jgi:DUF1016 N-terminal domain
MRPEIDKKNQLRIWPSLFPQAGLGRSYQPREDSMSDSPIHLTPSPEGYADWLADLKGRIHSAQQRATLAVNRELVLLYWQIGRDILARQAAQG